VIVSLFTNLRKKRENRVARKRISMVLARLRTAGGSVVLFFMTIKLPCMVSFGCGNCRKLRLSVLLYYMFGGKNNGRESGIKFFAVEIFVKLT
jgi:hypothetical protein